jgi:hypothetical protein
MRLRSQVLHAARAGAFDIHDVELRRGESPLIDVQAGDVIEFALGVHAQQAAKGPFVGKGRRDDKNRELIEGQTEFFDQNMSAVPIESYGGELTVDADRRPGWPLRLHQMAIVAGAIEPFFQACAGNIAADAERRERGALHRGVEPKHKPVGNLEIVVSPRRPFSAPCGRAERKQRRN